MPGNDFNLRSLRHGELQVLIARPFCKRFVPVMRLRPHSALQICNAGSSSTWHDKTRTEIDRGVCETGIREPAWSVGSGGKWQWRTRTNIGRAFCEKGILPAAWSVGSGGKWQWKTRTNIGQTICEKGIHRNPAARLECWERRRMSTEDKNEHRPKKMQKRNPTRLLECWERRQMALQDKNKHRPRKLRQKLPCSLSIFRQLSALRKLIARWGYMLNREAKLLDKLDKERQKVLRQRKAQHKKDQEERRRVEVLKQKQRREEERLRRELIRKRMRSDLTMDDILGQKGVRKYPNCKKYTLNWLDNWIISWYLCVVGLLGRGG